MNAPASVLDSPEGATLQANGDRVDLWVIALAPDQLGAARAELRRVLAGYLGVSPAAVELNAGPDGKPRLAEGSGIDLRFNLSHSDGFALIAVRLGHEVGVDVEAIRPGVDEAAIAAEHFDPSARAALAEDSSDSRFFRAWARHEALAKATGRGIAGGSEAIEASRFRVLDVEGIPGCAAAVASEGDGWSVRRI